MKSDTFYSYISDPQTVTLGYFSAADP